LALAEFFSRSGQIHRRSQDFLWGALFSSKTLTTFVFVALKSQAKTTKSTTPFNPSTNCENYWPTERLTGSANAQDTLQHFHGASAPTFPCLRAPMMIPCEYCHNIPLKTRFFQLHFTCRMYRCIFFNDFYVIDR